MIYTYMAIIRLRLKTVLESAHMTTKSTKTFLTPKEAAARLMVAPVTIRAWAERGWLTAQVTAGGHRRYLVSDVETFAHSRGLAFSRPGRVAMRILVVDDDLQVISYLEEMLNGCTDPIEIEAAQDGFEAGFMINRFDPDIVLLDLMMPGMNGFEACRRIKADPATATIRVVAMTGYPSPENVQRIVEAGAEQCFAKPINEPALLGWLGLTTQPQHKSAAPIAAGE